MKPSEFEIIPGLSFRGWLPTVTGQLSFSVFGRTTNPKAVFENVADRECRHLVVFQTRKTGDAIIPFPKIETKFLFVFVANTGFDGKQNSLIGTSYIVRKASWAKTKEKLVIYQKCLRTAQNEVTLGDSNLISPAMETPRIDLVSYLDGAAIFKAHVRIARSGTTDIRCDPTNLNSQTSILPTSEIRRERMLRAVNAQIFFFLKDIGHRHQHHHRTTDTITDIYPIVASDKDIDWRSATLYNIYRKVIEFKRSPDKNTFNDCLGLLAYADAFKKISKRELGNEKRRELPAYYSDEISKSVIATQSKWERQTEEKRYNEDLRRNILIAVFGAIFAYISLMQFDAEKVVVSNVSPVLMVMLRALLVAPGKCFLIFILLVYIDVIGRVRSVFEPESILIRLFASYSKKLLIISFAIVFLVGVYLLFIQIKNFF